MGEQFVTISGVITGPTVNEHPVYARMAVDVNAWPSMGDLMPVVYSPKNPDNWRFAPPEQPPAAPAAVRAAGGVLGDVLSEVVQADLLCRRGGLAACPFGGARHQRCLAAAGVDVNHGVEHVSMHRWCDSRPTTSGPRDPPLPDGLLDLLRKPSPCFVATLMPTGRHNSPRPGCHRRRARRAQHRRRPSKARNLARDTRVALNVVDPENVFGTTRCVGAS